MASTILLITNDATVRRQITAACASLDVALSVISSVAKIAADAAPDLVVCLDDDFQRVQQRVSRACIVLYGGAGSSERAIEAIKRGAVDYLVQPFNSEQLARQLDNALRVSHDIRVPAVYDKPEPREADVDRIVGQSPAMQDMYKAIGRIAPRDINVLITGESGTGKELVARAILHHSARRDKPFLAVNCAAIPETLLESELFGHEQGAFTGADHRRIGKFEQCSGGTLFLDEIGDIPLATQAKLLRVLQDQTFQRLGGSETITCDVRIIAATHQSLEQLIERRAFRQDLFYRLNVASIHVPPLREREVDAVLLAHYFVERYKGQFRTEVRAFAPDTLRVLLRYPWPGNVRELENAIKAALVMARGPVLRPEFLPEAIQSGAPGSDVPPTTAPSTGSPEDASAGEALLQLAARLLDEPSTAGQVHSTAIARLEAALIRAALRRHRGRVAPAARQLGISRTTLRKKMDELGIDITTS